MLCRSVTYAEVIASLAGMPCALTNITQFANAEIL
jgi:hypothetical protein